MYETKLGRAYVGDAHHLLSQLNDETVDLVLTSPAFAPAREKARGNEDQTTYVDWLLGFCQGVQRVLRSTGSLVLDLGGSYSKSRPVRLLMNYRVLSRLCHELDFRLAKEFFWDNRARLPLPIEWVNNRQVRSKDSLNTVTFWANVIIFLASFSTKRFPSIWWLSKHDCPKADAQPVLKRPSDHDISGCFADTKSGAIPTYPLEIPNTGSSLLYRHFCKLAQIEGHPARFPEELPAFFIAFLTDPGDLVLDFFAGSNTTGAAAEAAGRQWIAFESDSDYLAASVFRFAAGMPEVEVLAMYERLRNNPEAAVRVPT
ncbi:MAG: site-specific DNA-methyltransferase [Candidatus Rokubacteria bacterium]|nr:site-specific DNA-methyltransferase [Candidatus Rokubacteria bacterium]